MGVDVSWNIAQFLATALVAAYAWVESRQRATREQLEAVREAHEARLSALERVQAATLERLTHLPTGTELHRLEVAVTELRGEVRGSVGGMSQKLDSVHRRTQLIEDWLGEQRMAKAVAR